MPIPLRTALIGRDSGATLADERLIVLEDMADTVVFEGIKETPMLSINRGFSAPIALDVERAAGELERLAAYDTDPFARYEALQELMMRAIIAGLDGEAPLAPVVEAVRETLESNQLDAAFKADAILPPSETMVAGRLETIDPDAIHASRERLRQAIGAALGERLESIHAQRSFAGDDLSNGAKGERRLRAVCLNLLAAAEPARAATLAKAQYDAADNMTERQGALGVLVSLDTPERAAALNDFYRRFQSNELVIDKWFALQAAAQRASTLDDVLALAGHPDFTIANPNRLRSLVGMFGGNQWAFNAADGRGYDFVADTIIAADKVNPQVAARMVPAFGRWRRMEAGRSALMKAALERIVAEPGLSKDVFEQASKSLA
jgi:aminopeptidase N